MASGLWGQDRVSTGEHLGYFDATTLESACTLPCAVSGPCVRAVLLTCSQKVGTLLVHLAEKTDCPRSLGVRAGCVAPARSCAGQLKKSDWKAMCGTCDVC